MTFRVEVRLRGLNHDISGLIEAVIGLVKSGNGLEVSVWMVRCHKNALA
jgi:hypothetical protein